MRGGKEPCGAFAPSTAREESGWRLRTLSPRMTSPRFSALERISSGRQNGREYHSYGSWVLVDVSLFTCSQAGAGAHGGR